MASTKTPQLHGFSAVYKGTPMKHNVPRPLYIGLEVEFTGRYLQAQLRNPATDDGNPASWMIYEAETKRNEPLGPNGKFDSLQRRFQKNDRLQASNKNNFHEISMILPRE